MKKFVVLLVVVALTLFSAAAFAADISVSGSLEVRSRDFTDLTLHKDEIALAGGERLSADEGNLRDTQERVRLTVDAKAGDVKGRIQIENDWDTWGRLEAPQGNHANTGTSGSLDIREAWINFNLPGIPVNVNVGHQFVVLGNGWFVRNAKYGDDAWILANVTGNNTLAFGDVKVSEGLSNLSDDIDFYALLDVYKLSDTMTVGVDLSDVVDRRAEALGGAGFKTASLQNIGLNFNGAFGPMNLKAELDYQMGSAKTALATGGSDMKFKGNQIVVQGNVGMDPIAINFTLARGSGVKNDFAPNTTGPGTRDYDGFVNFLDADQHYTLLYEYKIGQPAYDATTGAFGQDGLHFGFNNTTALNVGVSTKMVKSLDMGIDFWYLQATQKVKNGIVDSSGNAATSTKLGYEIDAHVNWQMYDNLSWNWQLGYFKPGDAYKSDGFDDQGRKMEIFKDPATGIQGVLNFKF